MTKKRPVNLNLITIRFPVTAIVSILHRLSGVLTGIAIPFLLWLLQLSLSSPNDFALIQHCFQQITVKISIWIFLTSLLYHFLAGIRHFVMDAGYGESLKNAKISAIMVILFTLIFSALLGKFIW